MVEDAVITEQAAKIAAALSGRTEELTLQLITLYDRELPHLVHDDERVVSLLSASVYQNIDTALRIFQHGIDPTRVEAPAAAIEYARRLAQRGTPVIDLIRAYQLGQTAILDYAMAQGAKDIDNAELLGEVGRRAMSVTFAFIDRVTQQVVSAYEEERDRWLLSRNAVRTARVRALLDGQTIDLDTAELALGYRLRGTHLGVITWFEQQTTGSDALARLETVAIDLAKRVECPGRPLFVPCDESSAWAWLPFEEDADPAPRDLVAAALEASDEGVRIAFGEPSVGVPGFRRTHRQALRVQGLRMAAGEDCDRVLAFREVGAVALMAADLDAARMWVADTLGEMADDGPHTRRLRETLRVFLATGSSYTAAAAQLTMHKNSVQYRVQKAQELLGRPVADNRLDVELALTLCHWLGPAVLQQPH